MAAGRVVVIGGGIGGLAAAYLLAPAHDVLVLEASTCVGGKLRSAEVAGLRVDVGAEAMLNRRPEGVALVRAVGLPVVHPAVVSSRIWTRGALRPLPRSLMGVPLDLREVAASGVLSEAGLARVAREPELAAETLDGDTSVGALVARRFGEEVVDRLVEPLLGGVYAGRAREISVRAALPRLVELVAAGSVLAQAATVPTTYDAPVFAGVDGGLGRLPGAVVATGGFTVRTGATVRGLRRVEDGFEIVVGSAHAPEALRAERVVIATPAPAAGRLLREVAPVAAAELAGIESASTVLVTLAFRTAEVPAGSAAGPADGLADGLADGGSGLLVPPVEQRRIKAATYSSAKWAWVRTAGEHDGLVVLRTSLGRHREEAALQATDEELVAASLGDLADATGLTSRPVDAHVQRWGGGFPQYAVGHLDRVARIRADVARVPGLAVCGAAYDGVGIPAVIASARRAVADLGAGTMEG